MFLLDHSNMGHTQDGPVRRQVKASAIIVGAAAAALFASAHAFANEDEASTRMAREHHACAVIMGLPQPGKLYDACITSLDQSLAELDQARLVSTDRSGCERKGLRPGTPAFATCVINAEKSQ
jgi:hypothetical protein